MDISNNGRPQFPTEMNNGNHDFKSFLLLLYRNLKRAIVFGCRLISDIFAKIAERLDSHTANEEVEHRTPPDIPLAETEVIEVEQEEPIQSSMSPIKCAKEIADLIKEYDRRAAQTEDAMQKSIYEEMTMRLTESLVLAGCTPINPQEDDIFDFGCHETRPFMLADGQRILRTVRMGAQIEDRVLVKAIVTLKIN